MFEEMNLALPMPTQLLLAASDFFQGPIGWTLALSVLGAPVALFLLSSDRARLQPIFFAGTVAALLSIGVVVLAIFLPLQRLLQGIGPAPGPGPTAPTASASPSAATTSAAPSGRKP